MSSHPKDSAISSAEMDASSREGSGASAQPVPYNAAGLTPVRTAIVLFRLVQLDWMRLSGLPC